MCDWVYEGWSLGAAIESTGSGSYALHTYASFDGIIETYTNHGWTRVGVEIRRPWSDIQRVAQTIHYQEKYKH